jgi:hypothetical protein
MRHLFFGLAVLCLVTGCEREVITSDVQDQSGATAESKMDIGTHGTAPRPTEKSGTAPAINNAPKGK